MAAFLRGKSVGRGVRLNVLVSRKIVFTHRINNVVMPVFLEEAVVSLQQRYYFYFALKWGREM